jgi:hypothetical protein
MNEPRMPGTPPGTSQPTGRPNPNAPRTPAPAQRPAGGVLPKTSTIVVNPMAPEAVDLTPLSLVEEQSPSAPGETKIRPMHGPLGSDGLPRNQQWKRQPFSNGTGAMRVRSFHGRLSDQGMEYLDNAINEWLEAHPEVEVKFVTSSSGMFETKLMREPCLILNVWY